jgi:hypothetical protein
MHGGRVSDEEGSDNDKKGRGKFTRTALVGEWKQRGTEDTATGRGTILSRTDWTTLLYSRSMLDDPAVCGRRSHIIYERATRDGHDLEEKCGHCGVLGSGAQLKTRCRAPWARKKACLYFSNWWIAPIHSQKCNRGLTVVRRSCFEG